MVKAIRASVLVLLLTCSARAGWIQNGSPQPEPTPAPASITQEPTTTHEDTSGAAETLTQIALDLASSVLSLL